MSESDRQRASLLAYIQQWQTRSTRLRALSIQQPWAYCITNGTKRIENRTWYTGERGWRLIHAGKSYQTGMEHAIHADSPELSVSEMKSSARGGFVGIANLVDCIDVAVGRDGQRRRGSGYISDRIAIEQRIWTAQAPEIDDKRQRQYGFEFEDPLAFPEVIPYRGELGFFNVSAEVTQTIISLLETYVHLGGGGRPARVRLVNTKVAHG